MTEFAITTMLGEKVSLTAHNVNQPRVVMELDNGETLTVCHLSTDHARQLSAKLAEYADGADNINPK